MKSTLPCKKSNWNGCIDCDIAKKGYEIAKNKATARVLKNIEKKFSMCW